jgi:hypothetical protein
VNQVTQEQGVLLGVATIGHKKRAGVHRPSLGCRKVSERIFK